MKFGFSKGKRDAAAGYASVKGRTQDIHRELYTVMLQLFPEGAFYQQAGDQLLYVRALMRSAEPSFLTWFALHLREELQLRSLSLVLTAELAAAYGDQVWARQLIGQSVHDAAELPEWLDYYILAAGITGGKKLRLPVRLRKSLQPVFNRLDEYHFSRYGQQEQERLKWALLLVHPAPGSKTKRHLFDRIVHDGIPARHTWFVERDILQDQSYDTLALKQSMLRDKYKEGILSFRMGYAGLLDNLQAILGAGISGKVLKLAAEYIAHPAAVAESHPSPLRLLTAYRRLKGRREGGVPLLLEALEKAAEQTARLAGVDEKASLVIAMDVSNSMKQKLSAGSCIQRYDIGPLMALMLKDKCRLLTAGIIGNTWKPVDLHSQGILAGVDPFHRREGEAGYAINAQLVILDLLKKRKVVDKVMIFTDCSLWDNRPLHQPEVPNLVRAWQLYRRIAPNASLYLFDLAGYGHKPLEAHEEGVYLVSGWHDRIFGMLRALEERDSVIDRINDLAI